MANQSDHENWIEQLWRAYLTTGKEAEFGRSFLNYRHLYRLMRRLPTDPRCRLCYAPFQGIGGTLVRHVLHRERSRLNPQICNVCEQFASQHQGGAEIELSMLFADVRGSTGLAESMSPYEFSRLINRFYNTTTAILFRFDAMVEKLVGDEVTALFVPGFAGPDHAKVAVQAAQEILRATGHADPAGPWIPVGVGVHTGTAFVGAVGSREGITEFTALGDDVNIAARFASSANKGEVVISADTGAAAGIDTGRLEARHLELKGRSEPVDVWVLRVEPARQAN